MQVNFLKVRDVKTPQYSSEGAAALDFYLPGDLDWENKTLRPGESVNIPSGICMELPQGTVMVVLNKSGKGIQGLIKGAELIDEDYRGEIHINIFNVSNKEVTITAGQKIVQMIVIPYLKIKLNESKQLSSTKRNAGGFGSTGLS